MKEGQKTVNGFKGYNPNLKCREFKYEIGKEYQEEKAKACESGFHFCENPLDIFNYYPPSNSRFTQVEGSGIISKENSDSKVACSNVKIGAEITLKSVIEGGIKFIFERVNWTKENTSNGNRSGATSNGNRSGATSNGDNSGATSNGDNSGATSNGYSSGATSNGDNSGATSNGYSSGATSNGDNSGATSNGNRSGATSNGDNSFASAIKGGVATAIGENCKVKGKIGAWLILIEGAYDENYVFYIKNLKSKMVDGKSIKEDTFYKLLDNKIIKA